MAKLKGNRSIGDATIAENHQLTGELTRIQFDSRRIKSDTPNRAQFEPLADERKCRQPQTSMQACRFGMGPGVGCRFHVLVHALQFGTAKGRKGVTMDFAIILIVSNTLLAAFIYFVVTRIWQD